MIKIKILQMNIMSNNENSCNSRSPAAWRLIYGGGGLSGVIGFFFTRSKFFTDIIGNKKNLAVRQSITLSIAIAISFGLIFGSIERIINCNTKKKEDITCNSKSGTTIRLILASVGLSGVSSFFLFRSKKFTDLIVNDNDLAVRESLFLSSICGISIGLLIDSLERYINCS